MDKLIELIHSESTERWSERSRETFASLFGSGGGRYEKAAEKHVQYRTPDMKGEDAVSFSALIPPNSPPSGAYGGMSFVLFPVSGKPALVAMVVGTQGLNPDEEILSRPGHGRKVNAICNWLNKTIGNGSVVAWAKQDPVRVDQDVPEDIKTTFSEYASVFARYGKVLYGIYRPTTNTNQTMEAVCALLDLFMDERGCPPLKAFKEESETIKTSYLEFLLPEITEAAISELLRTRRFVVIQGPPGTGKTRMALRVLEKDYQKRGQVVQFHPNTTYESFVGGLAPVSSETQLGFQFAPQLGYLMQAAKAAQTLGPCPYLLVIDEINRADLAKVLGEAIYLFEPDDAQRPALHMPFDFGEPFGQEFTLPENLHILGTMNSADRSIAILDVAIRRRFAFVDLWPQMRVVKELAGPRMTEAFRRLLSIFLEHSSDESLSLVPGHSYFLEKDDQMAAKRLRVHLRPLLEEYLAQGYVAGFSEQIRGFIQWLNSLPS